MSRTPQEYHQLAEEAADRARELLDSTRRTPGTLMGEIALGTGYAQLSQAYLNLAFSPGLDAEGLMGAPTE